MTEFDTLQSKELNVQRNFNVAGRNGRPAFFEALANVKMGNYFNASKSQLHFGAAGTGEVAGLASVHNCELYLPNKAITEGAYTCLELNLQAQASTVPSGNLAAPCSFISFKLGGDGKTTWEDGANSVLFQIDGFDGGANSCVDTSGAPGAAGGNIRIMINGADWFIPISAAGA